MTPLEFWSGVIIVVIGQLASVWINYRNSKAQAPLVEAQAEETMSEGWVKLAQEYARQIDSLKKLEVENAELRPLVLKLALQEKQIEQDVKDKSDWKRYSMLLAKQLEDLGQIPIPFRRYPNDGESQKVKAVASSDAVKLLQKENE